MFNTKLDFARKKKKEALRTLAQSGRLGLGRTGTNTNPLAFTSFDSSGQPSGQESKNPFLAELGKQREVEKGIHFTHGEISHPKTSYAAAVQGMKAQNTSKQTPPTFITQGPSSVNFTGPNLQKKLQPPSLSLMMPIRQATKSSTGSTSLSEQALLEGIQGELQVSSEGKYSATSKQKMLPASDPNCTSIHVKGIPDTYNNQTFLLDHFSKFGHVSSVECNPAKLFATVTYKHKHEAAQAKKLGKQLGDGITVQLFWSSISPVGGTATFNRVSEHIDTIKTVPAIVSSSASENTTHILQTLPPAMVHLPKGAARIQHLKDENKEYLPSDDNDDSEDGNADEGVAEGKDSVLAQKAETEEKMDTIAKYAHHNYYLRSLNKPVNFPMTVTTVSQFQPQIKPIQNIRVAGGDQIYSIPNPNLPLLPMPKGGTAADFCEALESRDKEIRKSLVKQRSITDATPIIGTCPDMCPEKERYQREERRCLHVFEVISDSSPSQPQVNHAAAVKEYSGSAADKEEPLPHELRPTGVLCMTMDYLATCIMDSGEGRRAEWYDFLWNRTRAIRKDITLQHLCNRECVGLVERCARFHILCAHLMCEEDLKAFDPKLNDENLTKSLQTLKQFYADLQLKEGIFCENEAEFCCYDVLLHLNDGDVLSTVQHYSSTVRDHKEVKFAVDAALAFESNNFVRFFKLVAKSTFLNACILHRYFSLVRAEAVRVLNQSHTTTQTPTSTFPLSSFVKMLRFDDNESAIQFLQHHGIEVRGGDVLFMKKGKWDINPYFFGRSTLVQSKNNLSFGEVIYGRALPAIPVHVPYSSFVCGTEPPQLLPTAPLPQLMETISAEIQEELSNGVATEEVVSIVNESLCEMEMIFATHSVCENILDETVELLCKGSVQIAIIEAHQQMEYLREQNAIMEVVIDTVGSELLTTVVATECQRECYEAAVYEASQCGVTGDLFEEVLQDEIHLAANSVFQQERTRKKLQVETLAKEHQRRVLNRYWKMWYSAMCERQRVRKAALDFPTAASLSTLPQLLDHLLPVEKRRKLDPRHISSIWGPLKTSEQLHSSCLEVGKQRHDLSAPIDLPSLLQDGLLMAQTTDHADTCQPLKLCWQLILSLPNQIRNTEDKQAVEWIRRKLSYCPLHNISVQSGRIERISLSCDTIKHTNFSTGKKLETVVKIVTPAHLCSSAELHRQIQGTTAVLMYLRQPNHGETVEGFCDSIMKQFDIVSIHEGLQKLPLLVVGSQSLEDDFLAYWLKLRITLNSLLDKNVCVSAIRFQIINLANVGSALESESQLCSCIQWLAQHYPLQPSIMHYSMKDFVEEGIMKHFISRVSADRDKRKAAGLPSQPLSVLVELYNAVLDHLIIAGTKSIKSLSWPVDFSPLFFIQGEQLPAYWNNPEYLQLIKEEMVKLKLPTPEIKHSTVSASSMHMLYAECAQYVSHLNLPGGDQLIIPILSKIKTLLHNQFVSSRNYDFEMAIWIPWDQVILLIVEQIFTHLHIDLRLAINCNSQEEFSVPMSWLRAEVETNIQQIPQFTEQVDGTLLPSPELTHHRHRSESCPSISLPWPEHRHALQASLKNERESSEKFELLLKQWANEPLQLPEKTMVLPSPPALLATDELNTKWNTPDAALELLHMKIRTNRLQALKDTIELEDVINKSTS